MSNATSKQRESPGRSVIARIVSGGQTGADRGGLDAAIRLGLAHGGWCPKGRRAEDGTIPAQYRLTETKGRTYVERTRRNVIDSDATVVFTKGLPTAGSRLTIEMTDEEDRPMLHIDIDGWPGDRGEDVEMFHGWLAALHVSTLNVAGSRESKTPGLHRLVEQFLLEALAPAAEEEMPLAAEPAGAWDSAAGATADRCRNVEPRAGTGKGKGDDSPREEPPSGKPPDVAWIELKSYRGPGFRRRRPTRRTSP